MATKTCVVIPTDFSETSTTAVQWAEKMATQLDAELHCITVVEPPIVYTAIEVPSAVPTLEEVAELAERQLEDYRRKHLAGVSVPVVTEVLQGRPVDEITGYAEDKGAAMIVMSTHGHSGLKHLLIGSTAEGVVRHAECPVLTVRGKSD